MTSYSVERKTNNFNKSIHNPGFSFLQFWKNNQIVCLEHISPSKTLLQMLREDMNCKGTKEGCGEGDCGACTVVVAEIVNQELVFSAVNSCIRLAHSIHGCLIWSVEDISGSANILHPVQTAMMHAHASQCGFCTPGFVMSLYAMYQNYVVKGRQITREIAQNELSGNLCRCTGYRPIIDAAMSMHEFQCSNSSNLDTELILQTLSDLNHKIYSDSLKFKMLNLKAKYRYDLPKSLTELLTLKLNYPAAQLIAGATDVGLSITKQFKKFDHIIDLTQVPELTCIEESSSHIFLGAGVKLKKAFDVILKDRPQLENFLNRFAGQPIRNSGTLGGNIANGSPIGDSMPLLISLGGSIIVSRIHNHKIHEREIPLNKFYIGYRQNILKPSEIITLIKLPKPNHNEILRAYKISKRFDDDISAVCLCINISVVDNHITFIGIGAGGVASTPAKAFETERYLLGKEHCIASFIGAKKIISQEFSPLSDMRASAGYRRQILENLMYRFAIETVSNNLDPLITPCEKNINKIELSNNRTSSLNYLINFEIDVNHPVLKVGASEE